MYDIDRLFEPSKALRPLFATDSRDWSPEDRRKFVAWLFAPQRRRALQRRANTLTSARTIKQRAEADRRLSGFADELRRSEFGLWTTSMHAPNGSDLWNAVNFALERFVKGRDKHFEESFLEAVLGGALLTGAGIVTGTYVGGVSHQPTLYGFIERIRNLWPQMPGRSPFHSAAERDWIEASVFGPSRLPRRRSELIQVLVHLPERAEEAKEAAREAVESAKRLAFATLGTSVAPETKLEFRLTAPHLRLTAAVEELVWRRRTEAVSFEVFAPDDCPLGPLIGTVSIAADSVPIGRLKFQVQVIDDHDDPFLINWYDPIAARSQKYQLAFVSYASQDRNKVLARVQMLEAFGINYFQDVLNLSPGDRWEHKLYRNIDKCDLFLLFWSSNAKASEWVIKEAQYAFDRKYNDDDAAPAIHPIILEGPPPVTPPPELSWLHFDDPIRYFVRPDQPDA